MRTETRHKRKKLLCLLLVLCMMLGIMPTSVFAEGTKTEQTVTEETTAPETEQEEISSEPEATTEPASESMVETEEAEETETAGEKPGDSGSGEQKTKASLTRGSISPFSLPADRTSEISFENVVLTVNGTVVEEADDGGTFTIKYSNTSIIKFDWTANEDASFVSGDYFTFTVPEDFGSRMSTDGLAMTAVDGTVMGVIIFTKNTDGTYTATAIFNENVESLTNVSGTVKLQVTYAGMESKPVSWTFVLGEDEYIYEGSAEIRITGISDVAERVIGKGGSYQSNNNAYLWTMFFNEQTEKLTGTVTITDVLGSGQRITPYKGTTKGQYDYKIDYPAGDDNYYFRIRLIDYDTMRTDYNAMAVEYNVNGYEGLTASSKVLFDFLVNYSSNYAFIGTDGKIATVADNRITNFMKDGLVWTPDSTKPSTYRYIVDLGELGIDHYIELTEEGFMISLTDVGEYGVWIRYYTEATALMEQSKLENTAYLGTSKTTTSVNIGSSATVTGVRGSITLIKSNTHETKMFTGVEFVLEDDQGAKLTAKTNASGVLAFKLADFNYYDFTGTYTLTENPATTPAGYQCAAPITLELDASGAIVKINGQSVSATSGLTIEEVCRVTQDGLMITVYNKEYPSLTLTGTKTLTDHTDEGKTLKDYTFDFTVKDEDKKTVAEGTSNASGRITFDEITFTSSGTYTYKVTENVGSEAEMTYDTAEYTVVVVVAQNTVTEDLSIESIMVNGNAVSGTSNIAAAIVFDNTYGSIDEPVFVERTVTKTWSDSDNQDGKRPASIQVQLYAGANTYGSAVTLNAGNDWTYTWDNLPEKQDATDVVYTVRETGVPIGYTANYITTATGFNIINSYTPEKVDVGGTKTWNDADDRDGKRSTSITVNLLANGKEIDEKTVTADDDWAYAWTSLPKYSGGTLINYSITEDPVPDYGTVVSGYDITNSYTPGETSRTVTKAWEDEDDQDGKRPGSIQVQLYADGTEYGPAITLNETNEWTHTWNNLPEMQNKETVVYTVREMGVPTDYTAGYSEDGFAITNSYTPETVDVGGTKTWNDADDQDGKRPGSITVNLLANGTEIDEKTVTTDDDWAYAWTSLPKYSRGTLISYSITEDPVPNYGTVVTGYDITNSYTPGETSRTVVKVWEDVNDYVNIRPGMIQVQLYANGKAYGDAVTLNVANNWIHTWNNLPERQNGQIIVYTVEEVEVPESYVVSYSEDGFVITNTSLGLKDYEVTDISGTKTWDDNNDQDEKRPDSITVNLYANGTLQSSKTVTADDDWKYEWTGLLRYESGVEIQYTITENPVTDYSTEVDGYNITNTYTPGETSRTVKKIWNDKKDSDGIRPKSIKVQLYADGTAVGDTVKLNADNNWKHTWSGLAESEDGETVVYTVKEVKVPTGYTVSYSSDTFVITNKHNVTSNKNDDGNNNNGSNNNGYNNTRSNTINPKTGDYSNMVLWSLLLLAACAAMIFALYFNRKKRIQK